MLEEIKKLDKNRIELAEKYILSVKKSRDIYKSYLDAIDIYNKGVDEMLLKMAKSLTSTEIKVCYDHYIKGKTLKQIAKEMGYDYDYIKQINAKIKKKIN